MPLCGPWAGNYHEPLGIKNGACRLLDGNFSDANVSQFDLTYNE